MKKDFLTPSPRDIEIGKSVVEFVHPIYMRVVQEITDELDAHHAFVAYAVLWSLLTKTVYQSEMSGEMRALLRARFEESAHGRQH